MNSNYQALVKNFIPQSMRIYLHHRILQPKPALTYSTKNFEIDELDNFVIVPTDKKSKTGSYLRGANLTAPASNLSAGTGVGVGSGGGNTVVELIYQNIRKTSIPVGFPFPSKI